MSKQRGSCFHYRYKRYVRMMLRRYPWLWWTMLGSQVGACSRFLHRHWWDTVAPAMSEALSRRERFRPSAMDTRFNRK